MKTLPIVRPTGFPSWVRVSCLLAILFAGAQVHAQRSLDTPLDRSLRAVSKGDVPAAETAIAGLAKRAPESAGWHHEMAMLLTHLALSKSSGVDLYRDALAIRIVFHLNQAESKLSIADRGLKVAIKEHRAFVTERIAGRSDEALQLYREANALAPELGQTTARIERLESARRNSARQPLPPPAN